MKSSKILLPALTILFLMFGIILYKDAMPQHKEERIYFEIQKFNPYILEKRTGGLSIVNTVTGEKQKPSNADVFKVYDTLSKQWGMSHVKISKNDGVVYINDDLKQKTISIPLVNQKEYMFVKTYYGAM